MVNLIGGAVKLERLAKFSGAALGFLLPAFVYALVITRGSLDPFGWEYGWAAYNQYALALTQGRFDVPLDSIGAEGFIIGGKVYMYYGLLPAVARWPLMPFLDLTQTPVSLLMTWLFCTVAAGALQLVLLRIYWSAPDRTAADRLMLLAASLAVWFGSGPWLALQNGSFYHEPFAAGLMLSAIFTAMLVDDVVLRTRTPSVGRLCVYAMLAGLTVFARQTMAISLYAATLLLLAAPLVQFRWMPALRRAVPPALILAGFGLAYLWTVAVRFGGDSFPMASYGYYILYASDPQYAEQLSRLESIETVGQFHWSRFVPNLGWYLVGGHELRNGLVAAMGGGVTEAFGPPGRLALGWAAAFLFAMLGAWALAARRCWLALLVGALSAGAVLQLCYATAAYRYGVELWPPVALLMLVGFADWLRRPERRLWVALAFVAVAVSSLAYNLSRSAVLRNDTPFEAGSLAEPMPEMLTTLLQ